MGRVIQLVLVTALAVAFGTGAATARPSAKKQQLPTNTVLPQLSGDAVVGATLLTGTGQWRGPVSSFRFQWLRCGSSGSDCAAIGGATGSSHTVSETDAGGTLRSVVTATNKWGQTVATSAPSAPVVTTTATTTSGSTTTTTTGTTSTATTTNTPTPEPSTTFGGSLPSRLAEWAGTGNTYYVDAAAGNDSYTEAQARNESTPWRTIQKAVDSYSLPSAGHVRILVKNGTYRAAANANAVQATVRFGNLGTRTPSAEKVLQLQAYPGHEPVIQEPSYAGSTPGSAERHGLWFADTSARHIRVRGFRVTMSRQAMNQTQGFRIDASTDVELDQCEITGWKSAAVGSNPRSQGVYIGKASSRVHLYNLIVHGIGDPATEARNLSHGFYIQGSYHVLANVLAYDNRNGFGVQFYSGGGGGPGHIVTNLVAANNRMSGLVVDGTYSASVRNSVFYDNDQWGVSVRGSATVTASNSISYANGSTGTLGNGFNREGSSTLGLQNIMGVNPLFVNFGTRDFHLQTGSPAHKTGLATFTPQRDLDQASYRAPTVGAYRSPDAS